MLRESLAVSIGWIGISMVADGVPALLLPHRLVAEGGTDATTLGLITLVAIAVAAALQPIAGGWSDRVGRLPVIGTGTATAAAGLALLITPGTAVAGTVVTLAGTSVAQAGQQALLPDRVGADWRGRAGGMKGAFDVAGAFAGFLILAALLGAGQALLASGVLAFALVAGYAITRILIGSGRTTCSLPASPASEALERPRTPALVRLVVARFLFLLGVYAVGRFLLLFVAERFDLGADAAGAEAGGVLAVLALVTAVASFPAGWLSDRVGRRPMMLLGGAVCAVGIGLLPAASSLEAVLTLGALMAAGTAAFGSASWGMLGDLTASAHAGRRMGLANLGTAGAAAVAGIFGPLVDAGGFEPAFLAAAACTLTGGLLAWQLTEPLPHPAPIVAVPVEGAR